MNINLLSTQTQLLKNWTLFSLFKLVNEEGGFDAVCRERRWTRISVKMGFAPGKAIGSHLRAHYERILYPYNLFQTGANLPVRPFTPVSFPQEQQLLFTVEWMFIGRICSPLRCLYQAIQCIIIIYIMSKNHLTQYYFNHRCLFAECFVHLA